MSQTFSLYLATDTIANDALQIGVTVEDLTRICVRVSASIVRKPALHLQLTYQVTLPTESLTTQLNWPTWQSAQVSFSDYLWEETCLECFITGRLVNDKYIANADATESYIEVNASPDGRYALYQFEYYRHPAALPPMPLYQADGHTRAHINWTDNLAQKSFNDASTASETYKYERRFGVPLLQLPNERYVINDRIIEYIHPCVILQLGKTALYFAPSHASPPDFHNQDYWLKFDL